ncbi:YigZ family protein, partial [Methanobrevibacter sp. V14]|uniref:YigZ family protein n=2 Tax=unclassified Methanobrevibacter TaxID=2638681 RepID=UPI0027369855
IMKTIKKPVQSEINIKKSQFICSVYPTKNKKESKEIIRKLNQKYNDATHNCTAYIVEDGEGFDDDGEPGGTAGKPMINVLRKNELHNITIIVTRYFGGIKLGAGGLVRAYSKSVLEAIKEVEIVEIEQYDVYELIFEYSDIKLVDMEVRNNSLENIDKDYSDTVRYDVISKDNRDIRKIFEKYSGKIRVDFKNKQFLEKI